LSPELEKLVNGENVFHVELEVTSVESVQKAFTKVSEIVGDGGINLLINNVGMKASNDVGTLGVSEKDLNNSFHINVTGSHTVTRFFYPLLKTAAAANSSMPPCAARGAIINVSSQLASIANANDTYTVAYRVSKAALNMLAKCTAIDVIKDGVLCVAIHPGWVATDLGGGMAPLSTKDAVADIAGMIGNCTADQNGLLISKGMEVIPY
jgi:NAD(P)-dependent dehydrogenase (short-subunit alcohol dehydrogenase family)